jgi:hypothetical protein
LIAGAKGKQPKLPYHNPQENSFPKLIVAGRRRKSLEIKLEMTGIYNLK